MYTHTEGQTSAVENLLTLFLFDQKGFASVSAFSVNHKMASDINAVIQRSNGMTY
jgi:hypothetical protein